MLLPQRYGKINAQYRLPGAYLKKCFLIPVINGKFALYPSLLFCYPSFPNEEYTVFLLLCLLLSFIIFLLETAGK